MAGPAPNNYDFWADDNDRNYYNSLTTNVERVAFIRCIWTMMNPRTEPLKRKRPRSGKGRLKKWWERRSNKLKEATDEDRAGTLPLADPFVPAERPGSEGSRSPESEVDIERPSKRRRMSIGGGLSLPFIYHNDPTQNHYIPPTRTAREHIDGASEGERWRFATVLKQVNTNIPQADHRYGTSPKSLYLFVRVDTDDIIREQRVVKAFDTSFADIWTAQDFGKTFDEENTIREALSTTDCPHLVRYYNTSDQEQQFTIENAIDGQMAMNADNVARANWNHQFIYSEYAPHKTLRELINAVQSPDPPEPIPEHFILYVFARLLSALVALKAQRILHLVIKPENIFFGDPDERDATYPGYKRVMLGDFESAVQMVEDSEDHPNLPNDAPIALPWPPPELSHREDRGFNPSVNWRLSEKTDIYSLGLVIREMMICSTTTRAELDALRNRETERFAAAGDDPISLLRLKLPDCYSWGLIDTVNGCLIYDNNDRRTLEEIKTRVDLNLTVLDDLLGPQVGSANFPNDHPLWVPFPRPNRFAIGQPFLGPTLTDLLPGILPRDTVEYATELQDYNAVRTEAIPNVSIANQARALEAAYLALDEQITTQGTVDIASIFDLSLGLKHLRSTILPLLSPHGIFHQAQGAQDRAFHTPEVKAWLLEQLGERARELEDARRAAAALALAGAAAEEEDPEPELDLLAEEAFCALKLACWFGVFVLRLGARDDAEERGLATASATHRGVWAYVLSDPVPARMEPLGPVEEE